MSGIARLSNCKAILGVLAILFVLSGFFDCVMNLDTISDNQITVGENTFTNSTIENNYEGKASNPALFFLTSFQSVQQDSTFKAKKISSTKKTRFSAEIQSRIFHPIYQNSEFITTFQSRFRRTCPSEDGLA